MPTQPFRRLLDRSEAVPRANDLIQMVSPVLRETVNYSTAALARCERQMAPTGDTEDVHVAPLVLYRRSIELTDGIEVLLSQSCVEPAIPVLRSSFETTLGLRYIFKTGKEKDEKRRSLAWLCGDVHGRMRDDNTIRKRKMSDELSNAIPDELVADAERRYLKLESFLQKPHMQEVLAEYQAHGRRRPHWYSLFDGPDNLRCLAEHLNWVEYYDLLYRRWSSDAHATGGVAKVFKMTKGRLTVEPIRSPQNMLQVAAFTQAFHMYAMTTMTKRYRRDEEEQRKTWYSTEIASAMERIHTTQVDTEAEPYEDW